MPRAEVQTFRQNIDAQNKLVKQLENMIKYIWYCVDYFTEKTNMMEGGLG